jgi:hypothetical protein
MIAVLKAKNVPVHKERAFSNWGKQTNALASERLRCCAHQ